MKSPLQKANKGELRIRVSGCFLFTPNRIGFQLALQEKKEGRKEREREREREKIIRIFSKLQYI